MAAYTTTTAGPILREVFDPVLGNAISKRNSTYAWFRRKMDKPQLNSRGYYFSLKTRRNQGYGSLTSAQEGGLLPRSGAPAKRKVRADYRSHFVSGELTGDVLAQSKNASDLVDLSKDSMQDAVESFDTFQDFYLFGNGSGALGVVTATNLTTTATFALAQATPYGSMMLQDTQRIQFFHPTTFVQYTGGSVTVSTVASKVVSTDVVTFDAVPNDLAVNAIACIEDTVNREVQGLDFYVGNSGTTSLADGETGTAINRAANPWINANVIDAAGAALSPDQLDLIQLQTSSQVGESESSDAAMLSHAAQKFQYRQLGYALNRTVNLTGNQKLDLGFGEVTHNGMEWRTSAHCQPDRIYGLRLNSWLMPEIQAPHMKNFPGGTLIQKYGTDRPYDAVQFAVEARYTLVCKEPFNQFLLKNLYFDTASVRRNLN